MQQPSKSNRSKFRLYKKPHSESPDNTSSRQTNIASGLMIAPENTVFEFDQEYPYSQPISEIGSHSPGRLPLAGYEPNCESFLQAMEKNGVYYTNTSVTDLGHPIDLGDLMDLQSLITFNNDDGSIATVTSVSSVNGTTSEILKPYLNEYSLYYSNTEFMLARQQILEVPYNIDEHVFQTLAYIKHVGLQPVTFTGGKRKRRYPLNKRTMKRRGKLMKGGFVSGWICAHPDFLTSSILLSFVGGGFWCLGTYIIPVAMNELRGVVWNYIVKT